MGSSFSLYRFAQTEVNPGREMDEAVDFIREGGTESCYQAAVSFEEAFMNVSMHAYGKENKGPVLVSIKKNSKRVVIVIADFGKPFNPVKTLTPPLDVSRIGGHGLRLMKTYTKVSYARVFGMNLLKITKIL